MAVASVSLTMVLDHKIDKYNGVIVEEAAIKALQPSEVAMFEQLLQASLSSWIALGRKGIWIKVAGSHSSFIPVCLKHGLDFHHADKGFVMLNRWLPEKDENKLPEYASHTVGVGGFTVNDKGEVLVVSEKFADKFMWKLPGGYVKPGEEIYSAAIREVLEETNVQTEFVSMVCFRQMFPGIFGRSDLYFIALLKPLTHEIKIEEAEIADAKWMPLTEYMKHPDVVPTNRFIAESVHKVLSDTNHPRILPHQVPSTWNPKFSTMYALGEHKH